MLEPNDVEADGKDDCALIINPLVGLLACCSCALGSSELQIVTSWTGGRARCLSVTRVPEAPGQRTALVPQILQDLARWRIELSWPMPGL